MAATDDIGEQIRELTHALDEHREELRVVRDAIDELREVVDYLIRRFPDPTTWTDHLRRITSMPRDPAAPDFHRRLNAVSREDVTASDDRAVDSQPQEPGEPTTSAQTELF